MVRTFSDEPMVRNIGPEENHNGFQEIVIIEGFCMIDGSASTTNYDTQAVHGISLVGSNREKSLVIKADVPALTRPGEKCLNATLRIWLQEPIDSDLVISLHRLLKAFVRSEVTWEQAASGDNWSVPGLAAGVDYELTAEITGTVESFQGSPYIDLDLTTWIRDVCNEGGDNFGFILNAEGTGDLIQYFYGTGASDQQQPTLIIQTAIGDTWTDIADTSITEYAPTTNYGTDTLISICNDTGPNNHRHGLWRFDVQPLDPGAELVEALLTLTPQTAQTANEYGIYPMLVSWKETEATWQERETGVAWGDDGCLAGVDYDDSQRIEWIITNGVSETVQKDILPIVKQWLNGSLANNGILLRYERLIVASRNWYTREAAGTDPYIELTYRS